MSSSRKATPRRKPKSPMVKVSNAAKESPPAASYSFVPDDEVQDIIRDVEKFSIRRSKNEDDNDGDEPDDSVAVRFSPIRPICFIRVGLKIVCIGTTDLFP